LEKYSDQYLLSELIKKIKLKNKSIYIIVLIILFTAFSDSPSTINKSVIDLKNSYFPVNNTTSLVYSSSFGESITKNFQDGKFIITSSESDKFKYRQTLIIQNDGVYVKETYQYLKIFLFLSKTATFTYEKPLLRFPLPLTPGKVWKWEGDEYSNGVTHKVKVTGRVLDMETVTTKAGKFEALKLESVIEGSGNSKNIVTEWYAKNIGLIKAKIIIEGGGLPGILRDFLGYGTINFELEEIKK
jgi:hypothetical protein